MHEAYLILKQTNEFSSGYFVISPRYMYMSFPRHRKKLFARQPPYTPYLAFNNFLLFQHIKTNYLYINIYIVIYEYIRYKKTDVVDNKLPNHHWRGILLTLLHCRAENQVKGKIAKTELQGVLKHRAFAVPSLISCLFRYLVLMEDFKVTLFGCPFDPLYVKM